MKKRLFSLVLALALCLGMTVPASASSGYEVLLESNLAANPYGSYQNTALVYSSADEGCRLVRYTGSKIEFVTSYTYPGHTCMYEGGYSAYSKGSSINSECVIDSTGKTVIPAGEYENIYQISDGYAVVGKTFDGKTKKYFVDLTSGSTKSLPEGTLHYGDGLISIWSGGYSDGQQRYEDLNGNVVLTLPTGYHGGTFLGGYAVVDILRDWTYGGGYQIIDRQGNIISKFLPIRPSDYFGRDDVDYDSIAEYTVLGGVQENLICVREKMWTEYGGENNRCGYADIYGNIVISCEYEPANRHTFCNGYVVLEKITNGKHEKGLINRRGEIIIPFGRYQNLSDVSETGLVWAQSQDGMLCLLQVSTSDTTPETPSIPTASTVDGFTDVKTGDYYTDAVQWAVEKDITSGTSRTTFSPNNTCSNAEILTFLWRANGSPEPTAANPFDDIKATDYFYKAALWAAEKGLVSGSTFDANTDCTRAMTMEYMWKAAGSPAASYNGKFNDVPASADYAQAIAWAVENKITSGTGGSNFSPAATCTRGQIVTFLHRAMGK